MSCRRSLWLEPSCARVESNSFVGFNSHAVMLFGPGNPVLDMNTVTLSRKGESWFNYHNINESDDAMFRLGPNNVVRVAPA